MRAGRGRVGPRPAGRAAPPRLLLRGGQPCPPPLTPWPAGPLFFFFLIFMITLSMFKNWDTLRSSQN